MNNKTIINGIDVSGCEFYFEDNGVIAPDGTPERANICTSPEKSCENSDSCYCNKDCYYKQLKRLQKENEELKKKVKDLDKMTGIFSARLAKKYKQALEEIREMLKKSMSLKSNAYNHFINVEKAIDKINEVLNDRN